MRFTSLLPQLLSLLSLAVGQPIVAASEEHDSTLWRYARQEYVIDRFDISRSLLAMVEAFECIMSSDTLRLDCDGSRYLEIVRSGETLRLTITPNEVGIESFGWIFGTDSKVILLDSAREISEVQSEDCRILWVDETHCEVRDGTDSIVSRWWLEQITSDSIVEVKVMGVDFGVYSTYRHVDHQDSGWHTIDVMVPAGTSRAKVIKKPKIDVEVVDYSLGEMMETHRADRCFYESWSSTTVDEDYSMHLVWDRRSISCSAILRAHGKKYLRFTQLSANSPSEFTGSTTTTYIEGGGETTRTSLILTGKR